MFGIICITLEGGDLMKYFIISAGFFISAAILYSARYITSGLISLVMNAVGDDILTPHTQPLLIWSVISVILAVLFLIIGLINNDLEGGKKGIKDFFN
jgi:hypothetical protein